MDTKTVSQELAEELRTNTALRHRLGMEEGSMSMTAEDSTEIWFETAKGEGFRLEVKEA